MKTFAFIIFMIICVMLTAEEKGKPFFFEGALYQDWMGFKTEGSDLYQKISTRLKLTLGNRPGDGLTVFVDVRNRFTPGDQGKNVLTLYDIRLSFDSMKSKFFFSLGQMNMYDSAGIGILTGAVAGYKINKYLGVGAYGGLEPDIYNTTWDTDYRKFGAFVRYIGRRARQFSLSYNMIRFNNQNERRFLYLSTLMPVSNSLIFFGTMEYELDSKIRTADRLSQLFVNSRLNLGRYADVTVHYSSGRGLDYHQFLLEQSQSPSIQNTEIDRFYYSQSYGARLSITPVKKLRLHLSRQESEQKDLLIKNHTTGFGFTFSDILKTGVSLYANYNLNRGDYSESDTYYISASRNFGKVYWTLNYANFYNGVRVTGVGSPTLVRLQLPSQQTISTDLFIVFSRALAISLDYAYSDQESTSDHQFFVRLILRK